MKYVNLILTIVGSWLYCISLSAQWCCIDSSLAIIDDGSTTLRLQINGALNNDLSTPQQGLCGVRVKFNHKFIGDLTLDLVSPSGQSVRLVGPVGNAGRTDFTRWNVTFLPCSQTPIPDPGFKAKWDNIQGWGILGTFYSGTYHPNNGCLEDFNLGPVNGTWSLQISDGARFYSGFVESFCLLFCDDRGIGCSSCSPNGGVFSQSDIILCEQDPGLDLNLNIQFPNFTPDPINYQYKFVISQNDIILALVDKVDLRNYPPGEYQICGLSYSIASLPEIPDPATSPKLSNLKQSINEGKNGICAELSKNCINVSVGRTISPTNIQQSICQGDTFLFNGKSITQTGNYQEIFKSLKACDSIVNLSLQVVFIHAEVSSPVDSLSCIKSSIVIDASGSSVSTNSQISWTTNDGNIIDLKDPLKPIVDNAGTYKLKITDGNCSDSVEITIVKKGKIPDINIQGDTLTCDKKTIRLSGITSVSSPQYTWQFQGNDVGTLDFLDVTSPGVYSLIVTESSGCTNRANFQVIEDLSKPDFNIIATDLDCKLDSAAFEVQSNVDLHDFTWSGPSGFSSINENPFYFSPGKYSLTAKSKNGCSNTVSVTVNSTRTKPSFVAIYKPITCRDTAIVISTRLGTNIDTILWRGPNNFISTAKEPLVTFAGTYSVHLVDSFGCTLDTSIAVLLDTLKADLGLQVDLLDCLNDSVQINFKYLTGDSTKYSFNWSGPTGFVSYQKQPWVREIGLYTIQIVHQNGCIKSDTISVFQDKDKPVLQINSRLITCKNPIVPINATSNISIASWRWSTTFGFNSNNQNPLVDTSGYYRLVVTATNGCTAEKTIFIDQNKRSPFASLISDTINCLKDSITLRYASNNVILDSIFWKGPFNFTSIDSSPIVSVPGIYTLYAIGDNGCIHVDSFDLLVDTIKPNLIVDFDSLTCKKPTVDLRASSSTSNVYFTIRDPFFAMDTTALKKVTIPGLYLVTAIRTNHCTTSEDVIIPSSIHLPQTEVTFDTITCLKKQATLILFSGDIDIDKQYWQLPDSSIINKTNLITSTPGTYLGFTTNIDGCIKIDTIRILAVIDTPKYTLPDPAIRCDSILNKDIRIITEDKLALVEWLSPSGMKIIGPVVNQPGQGKYKIMITGSNGCYIEDSLFIRYDTLHPILQNLIKDTINCKQKSAIVKIQTKNTQVIDWKGPLNFNSSDTIISVSTPGLYLLTLTSKDLCQNAYVIEVVADTLPPNLITTHTNINCKEPRAVLESVAQASLEEFYWLTPFGDTLRNSRTLVTEGGKFVFYARNKNGCVTSDSVKVIVDTIVPILITSNVNLPCNSDSAQLKVQSQLNSLNFFWSGPNQFFSAEQNPYAKDTGVYNVIAVADNFCSSKASLRLTDQHIYPTVTLTGGELNCRDSSVQLISIFSLQDTNFIWSGPGQFLNKTDRKPTVRLPGVYHIKVTNQEGCVTDTFTTVTTNYNFPLINILQSDSLRCDLKKVQLVAKSDSVRRFSFKWMTIGGIIEGDFESSLIYVNKEGDYFVTTTDLDNGCSSIDTIHVNQYGSTILGLNCDINKPSCDGLENASLKVTEIFGGDAPYLYSINGLTYNRNPNLNNLEPGSYTLYIKDKFGCTYDTLISIEPATELQLDLGPDQSIHLGESFLISGSTNVDTSNLIKVKWVPLDQSFLCDTCFSIVVKPYQTTVYKLLIQDDHGCIAIDDILIKVNTAPGVFVPNVFSPNGDRLNDFLKFNTGFDIQKIVKFSVFDRWGELVYFNSDFDANLDDYGWDGKFEGQDMNPGVFICQIEALSVTGKSVFFTADVTLVR